MQTEKHIRKNNEVGWEDGERANYDVRRGNKNESNFVKIGITNRVRKLEIPDEMKNQVLGKGYVTTFFRAITTTPAKRKYGYKILENEELEISHTNFDEELKVIIYNMLNKLDFEGNKVDSRTLNNKESIEKYIDSIKPEDSKKVDFEIKSKTSKNLFGDKTLQIGNSNSNQPTNSKLTKSKSIPTGLFFAKDVPFNINNSSLRIPR